MIGLTGTYPNPPRHPVTPALSRGPASLDGEEAGCRIKSGMTGKERPEGSTSRQRAHLRFAIPIALLRRLDEAAEFGDALVRLDAGHVEQRLGLGVEPDRLEMAECVHHPLHRRG